MVLASIKFEVNPFQQALPGTWGFHQSILIETGLAQQLPFTVQAGLGIHLLNRLTMDTKHVGCTIDWETAMKSVSGNLHPLWECLAASITNRQESWVSFQLEFFRFYTPWNTCNNPASNGDVRSHLINPLKNPRPPNPCQQIWNRIEVDHMRKSKVVSKWQDSLHSIQVRFLKRRFLNLDKITDSHDSSLHARWLPKIQCTDSNHGGNKRLHGSAQAYNVYNIRLQCVHPTKTSAKLSCSKDSAASLGHNSSASKSSLLLFHW